MTRVPRITLLVIVALFCVTFVSGFVGWLRAYWGDEYRDGWDALYHTLLAFTGDESYVDPVNNWIAVARFTGLVTTISAILGVAFLYFHERIRRLLASFRKDHFVVIGASDFVLDVFRNEKMTIFDDEDTIDGASFLPEDALWIKGRIGQATATGPALGRPKAVVFGDKDTIVNVERAQTWLAERGDWTEDLERLILRVEEGFVARDLQLLSGTFRKAELVSRSETIARALLTSMVPTELALRRGQPSPHLALVGLGSINLAVAEEAALRCHSVKLGPLRLTIVDADVKRAKKRLRQERPDLLAFGDDGIQVDFVPLDALECCSSGQADKLLECEAKHPLTAIVVATGDDTQNAAIAMRLRQLQLEQLRLRAPIFMRSDSLATVSAAAPTDITGGVHPFGGTRLNAEDIELEALFHFLAEDIHNRWRSSEGVKKTDANEWKNMSIVARRASYRAALSAVEMFYAAGFAPPVGSRLAGLRLENRAANAAIGNDDLIRDLSEMEHERWIVERTLEGYRTTDGHRDDEKKLHPLMVAFQDLPDGEEIKDEKNVKATLNLGIEKREAAAGLPCWRRLVRVGLIGPLSVDKSLTEAAVGRVLKDMIKDFPDLAEAELEILTPNAPGFDRLGAIGLASHWKERTQRPARLILMNAAGVRMVDRIAASRLRSTDDPEAQSDALWSLAKKGHHVAQMDCRPLGVSDADLNEDREQYFSVVGDVQTSMMALADYMVFDREDGAEWTEKAIEHWLGLGKSAPYII